MTKTPTTIILDMARDAGLSNIDIAKMCGVSTVTVSRWRRDGKSPRLDTIAPLLVELGLISRLDVGL